MEMHQTETWGLRRLRALLKEERYSSICERSGNSDCEIDNDSKIGYVKNRLRYA